MSTTTPTRRAVLRTTLIGGVLLALALMTACGPTYYPFGDGTCWSAQTDEPQPVGVACYDEIPAEEWFWDGQGAAATWHGYQCEEGTEECPGQYRCERGEVVFNRLCAVPGTEASSAGRGALVVAQPISMVDNGLYSLPSNADGASPCGMFYAASWGVKQIEMANFPGCADQGAASLTVECLTSGAEWSALNVSGLREDGDTLYATVQQVGTCGVFAPAGSVDEFSGEGSIDVSFDFEVTFP